MLPIPATNRWSISSDLSFTLCPDRNSEKCCQVSWLSRGSSPRRRSSLTSPSSPIVVTNISPKVRGSTKRSWPRLSGLARSFVRAGAAPVPRLDLGQGLPGGLLLRLLLRAPVALPEKLARQVDLCLEPLGVVGAGRRDAVLRDVAPPPGRAFLEVGLEVPDEALPDVVADVLGEQLGDDLPGDLHPLVEGDGADERL